MRPGEREGGGVCGWERAPTWRAKHLAFRGLPREPPRTGRQPGFPPQAPAFSPPSLSNHCSGCSAIAANLRSQSNGYRGDRTPGWLPGPVRVVPPRLRELYQVPDINSGSQDPVMTEEAQMEAHWFQLKEEIQIFFPPNTAGVGQKQDLCPLGLGCKFPRKCCGLS
ncbi:uncharacterized protein LOC144580245 [Callithrix jacchus]